MTSKIGSDLLYVVLQQSAGWDTKTCYQFQECPLRQLLVILETAQFSTSLALAYQTIQLICYCNINNRIYGEQN
jgi:hypothetical protein